MKVFKTDRSGILTLTLIYIILSIFTLLNWNRLNKFSVTGDEVHYLIMTKGVIDHHTFEQTKAYQDEFKSKNIFKSGLASPDAVPDRSNTHTIQGPHGLYNVHNVGLPILILLPFFVGGIFGVKLFLILINSLIVCITWNITKVYTNEFSKQFLITGLLAVSIATIPSASQIFPDLLSGVMVLSGLLWIINLNSNNYKNLDPLFIATVSLLPWMQIKYTIVFFIIICAAFTELFFIDRDWKRISQIILVSSMSIILLLSYNAYAFGKITGPYQNNALQVSATSFMVLLGLLIDQNQGILFQNPILWFGISGIGAMFRKNINLAMLIMACFISLILPNSMHPNWYGGYSFSGRFGWTASLVLFIPAIINLCRIKFDCVYKTIYFVILLSIYQVFCFYNYAIIGVDLYNHNLNTPQELYSIYFSYISWMLPMFYNINWAFHYLTNYIWLVIFISVFLFGYIPLALRFRFRISENSHYLVLLIKKNS